ncbi:hypothetical protein VB796_14390 [Arcicella sp. LKC2W]|nr:hypothetical protein [Arcicella sp. LKC2W]MEA5460242.1 hypothetical protein [Arcicella sp. LKC2W]
MIKLISLASLCLRGKTFEKPFIFKATNMLEFQRVAYGYESAVLECFLKK